VRRYPRVSLDEVAARDPAIVLLPDEPYRFTTDAREPARGALADRLHEQEGAVAAHASSGPATHRCALTCCASPNHT
jgi:hypothetical protein